MPKAETEIYQPEEDSYLMSDVLASNLPKLLKQKPKLNFLEIGVGSGINMITAKKAGVNITNIFGTDINPKAVEYCRKLGFHCIKSDLFFNINGKFDILAFNPPYLPEDKREPKSSRRETTGGLQGNETIIKFLKQGKRHLNDKGGIFLITSSLSKEVDFNKLGYKARVINSKNLFFEKINAWELSLNTK